MNNSSKTLAIIALVVAIVGIGIGFAAFSSTLTISQSTQVTPNESDFKVCFTNTTNSCPSDGVLSSLSMPPIDSQQYVLKGVTSSAYVNDTSLTVGLKTGVTTNTVTFTQPGEAVYYDFNIYNAGEYTAYLRSISMGSPTCQYVNPQEAHGVNISNVCDDFDVYLGFDYDKDNQYVSYFSLINETAESSDNGDKWALKGNNGSNPSTIGVGSVSIPSKGYIKARFVIKYRTNGDRADGAFTISFPNAVSLGFSSTNS